MAKTLGSTRESFRAQYSFVVDGGVPFAFTLVQTAIECYREEDEENPVETWAEARKEEHVISINTM